MNTTKVNGYTVMVWQSHPANPRGWVKCNQEAFETEDEAHAYRVRILCSSDSFRWNDTTVWAWLS